jgi:hypothetical protein
LEISLVGSSIRNEVGVVLLSPLLELKKENADGLFCHGLF